MAEGLPRDLRLKAGSSSRAVDRGLGYSGTRLTLQLSFASCPKPRVASIRRFANCRESMSGWLDRIWGTARACPAHQFLKPPSLPAPSPPPARPPRSPIILGGSPRSEEDTPEIPAP